MCSDEMIACLLLGHVYMPVTLSAGLQKQNLYCQIMNRQKYCYDKLYIHTPGKYLAAQQRMKFSENRCADVIADNH